VAVAVLAALLAAPLVLPSRPAGAEVLNKVVLRVNDQIATLYDYQVRRADEVHDIMRRVKDQKEQAEALGQVGEQVFRMMFEELLLSSRADQMGIEVTDADVDDAIANTRRNIGIKTDAEFQQALAQEGLTLDILRAQTRRNLRIREVMGKEVQPKIKVKDEDLRRYYRKNETLYQLPEQVQLREVVVLEDSGAPAAERSRIAADIRSTVALGKSLAEASAPYAAKGQASSVVELGWVSPKDLDPKLETAAWKLLKNGVSEPVDARGGLHLIQLLDRHPAHLRPFSEVQAQIQSQEQERMYREESVKYLNDLETKSLVVAEPPAEAAHFRRKVGLAGGEAQGIAASGTAGPAGAPDATGGAAGSAAPGQKGEAGADATATHPASVDTSDEQHGRGGLPAPKPAGSPDLQPPVTIPPPSVAAPPTPAPPPAPASAAPPPPSGRP
jgi:peptidyl-prolyl cis-trans isomerase SurA